MTKILSDTTFVDKNISIEPYLQERYGDIVRWAIVEVDYDKFKVSFSYEAKEVRAN